jgi:hypothetical protein
MISIDNTMSDMEQMEAVKAATRPPEMPIAEAEPEPAGETAPEAEEVAAPETVDEPESDDEAGEDDAEPVVKKKGGFQRKLERKEQEIAALRAQIEALSTGGKTAEREAPIHTDGRPSLEQFDGDLEKYTEALVDWKAEQKVAEVRAKQIADSWSAKVKEAATEFDDFDEYADVQLPLTPAMREFLVESEIGPKLGYTLAKNTTEAQRIFGLPPMQQVKALAKLELELTGTKTTPVKQVTKASAAPPPIKPLAATAAPVVKDPRKMSFSEFEAWRNSGGK